MGGGSRRIGTGSAPLDVGNDNSYTSRRRRDSYSNSKEKSLYYSTQSTVVGSTLKYFQQDPFKSVLALLIIVGLIILSVLNLTSLFDSNAKSPIHAVSQKQIQSNSLDFSSISSSQQDNPVSLADSSSVTIDNAVVQENSKARANEAQDAESIQHDEQHEIGNEKAASESGLKVDGNSNDSERSESGFLDWLEKNVNDEESGENERVDCEGVPHEKLCMVMFRLLKKYHVTRILDTSCIKNARSLTPAIQALARRTYRVEYICASGSEQELESIRNSLVFEESAVSPAEVSYLKLEWWQKKSLFPPELDMVLAWDVLAHAAYGRVWRFFENLVESGVKTVVFDNYSGERNMPFAERLTINVRRSPFNFVNPQDIVQNMTSEVIQFNRQLVLYTKELVEESLNTTTRK